VVEVGDGSQIRLIKVSKSAQNHVQNQHFLLTLFGNFRLHSTFNLYIRI